MEYLAEIHTVCWIEIPNQRDSQQAAKSLLCLPTDKGWVAGYWRAEAVQDPIGRNPK